MEAIHGTIFDILLVWGSRHCGSGRAGGCTAARSKSGKTIRCSWGSSGDMHAREQAQIIARIEKLAMPIKLLTIVSVILLLAAGGAKLYEGFQSF